MKNAKKLLAKFMVLALILAYIPAPAVTTSAAGNKVTTKKYTLSQKAGTYSSAFKLTIAAKKGYKVYYSTGSNLNIKKVIKSGKKKTITISKTTTLKIYAVKKSTIVTKKKLKTSAVKKKTKTYKYTISSSTTSDTTSSTTTSTTATENSSNASTTTEITASTTATESTQNSSSTTDPASSSETPQTPPNGENGNPPTPPDGGNQGGSTAEAKSENTIQSELDASSENAANAVSEANSSVPTTAEVTGDVKANIDISSPSNVGDDVTVTTEDGLTTVTINTAGNYTFTGTADNTIINIPKSVTDPVNINLNAVNIDNSALTSASPVINSAKADLTITLTGESTIKGAGNYSEAPASAIIYSDNRSATLTITGTGTLNVTDSMDKTLEDYNGKDPSDGIASKGTLVVNSGTLNVTSNGDGLKGTNGGVTVNNGKVIINSKYGNGIKSKKGNVNITSGTVNILACAEDGINAKNGTAFISGGTINIGAVGTNTGICYGDGIQAEDVIISAGTINIATAYEYAATNFYDTSLTTYNTLTKTGQMGSETKTETVKIDTGSHKGIKAGSKEKTYSYTSVADGSDNEAGKEYTEEASGSLVITGGTINIDTTATGIKYNGSQNGSGAACEDQYIIGSPEDALHSNKTAVITGGNITIKAADEGIAVANTLNILDSATIDIQTSYEGIEAGTINIGKSDSSKNEPTIKIYSNDDGINAAKKTNVTYVYDNEDEETYVKTSTAGSGNTLSVTAGYVYVCIADDTTHTANLTSKDTTYSNTTTYNQTYKASGDGIDCNGSFYAYGGTVIVNGQKDNNNSPIDTDENYFIGEGATVLAIGSNMDSGPNNVDQAYITSSNKNIGSAGKAIEIQDSEGNKLFSTADYDVTLKNSISYLLFTCSKMTDGSSYNVLVDGNVAATLTATTTASTGGFGGGPGGTPPSGGPGDGETPPTPPSSNN